MTVLRTVETDGAIILRAVTPEKKNRRSGGRCSVSTRREEYPVNALENADIHCPYCGEPITLSIDLSAGAQHYVEDCQVCCRPIEIDAAADADGAPRVRARRQDET